MNPLTFPFRDQQSRMIRRFPPMEGLRNNTESRQSLSGSATYEIFWCQYPGCTARYQRKEHLSRHEKSNHVKRQAVVCTSCDREFRRSDTLRRHMLKQHKIAEPLHRARQACANCHAGKTRCEGGMPCEECVRRNVNCAFQDQDSIAKEQQLQPPIPRPLPSNPEQLQSILREKKKKSLDRYFELFHPCWPFIHKGTFDVRQEPPFLIQSMMAIGMWLSGEQSAQSTARELYDKLGFAVREQMEKWDASSVEDACSACFWPIATYQAVLLHIILSIIIKSDGVVNPDLRASIHAVDLALLKALVGSCRRLGMFFYPNMLSKFRETALPSLIWVGIEEVKRFNIALYRLCAKLSSFCAGDTPLLHASELQFPLPRNDALWNSVRRDEWEAYAKEENMISFDDDLRTRWISTHADLVEFLGF